MSQAIIEFVDALHKPNRKLWSRLQNDPAVIEDPDYCLTDEDRRSLREGPRAELLRKAGRDPGHTAVIMIWLRRDQ